MTARNGQGGPVGGGLWSAVLGLGVVFALVGLPGCVGESYEERLQAARKRAAEEKAAAAEAAHEAEQKKAAEEAAAAEAKAAKKKKKTAPPPEPTPPPPPPKSTKKKTPKPPATTPDPGTEEGTDPDWPTDFKTRQSLAPEFNLGETRYAFQPPRLFLPEEKQEFTNRWLFKHTDPQKRSLLVVAVVKKGETPPEAPLPWSRPADQVETADKSLGTWKFSRQRRKAKEDEPRETLFTIEDGEQTIRFALAADKLPDADDLRLLEAAALTFRKKPIDPDSVVSNKEIDPIHLKPWPIESKHRVGLEPPMMLGINPYRVQPPTGMKFARTGEANADRWQGQAVDGSAAAMEVLVVRPGGGVRNRPPEELSNDVVNTLGKVGGLEVKRRRYDRKNAQGQIVHRSSFKVEDGAYTVVVDVEHDAPWDSPEMLRLEAAALSVRKNVKPGDRVEWDGHTITVPSWEIDPNMAKWLAPRRKVGVWVVQHPAEHPRSWVRDDKEFFGPARLRLVHRTTDGTPRFYKVESFSPARNPEDVELPEFITEEFEQIGDFTFHRGLWVGEYFGRTIYHGIYRVLAGGDEVVIEVSTDQGFDKEEFRYMHAAAISLKRADGANEGRAKLDWAVDPKANLLLAKEPFEFGGRYTLLPPGPDSGFEFVEDKKATNRWTWSRPTFDNRPQLVSVTVIPARTLEAFNKAELAGLNTSPELREKREVGEFTFDRVLGWKKQGILIVHHAIFRVTDRDQEIVFRCAHDAPYESNDYKLLNAVIQSLSRR